MEKLPSKSRVYCCVPQCKSTYRDNVSFHHFPTTNNKLRSEWIRVLKIGKPVSSVMRVCGRHFKDNDFFFKAHVNKRHNLKKSVVPSLHLPIGSHDKKTDHFQNEQRLRRLQTRQESAHNSKEQITFHGQITSLNQDDTLLTREKAMDDPYNIPDDNAVEAAEALLLFSKNPQEKKYYEDKAIQVNTYEDLNQFDVSQIIDNNYKLKVLTGIQNMDLLNVMANALMKLDKTRTKYNKKKIILLTLMRIKLDLTFTALAILFNISAQTAQTYFHITIQQLGILLSSVIRFPSKAEILKNMPLCFNKFKDTRVVLDCTEIEVQKSKCLKCRVKSYSCYKGRHTIKFLIGVAPSGLITYLSKPYGGRASDKVIFNSENLISKLQVDDAIMVDKGFLIEKECAKVNVKLIRPPLLRKKSQLSKEEATKTADIARARVHVERSIQRIKQFRVCRNVIPWKLLPQIKHILTVVVALTNLSQPILASNKF